jgi:pimeloyl-ACP methyl ester carboxylesterase
MERVIDTADGRVLRVEEAGDPKGKPVLVFHGTPGDGSQYAPHVADAKAKGIRLISYDRPGYGGSTPQPGRIVADAQADVRAIAGELGLDKIAVWGVSGGGPYALMCAALLPDLVVASASLASPAPYQGEGLDYFTGMGKDNVDDIKLSLEDEPAARAKLVTDREMMLKLKPEEVVKALASLMSEVDAAAQTPELTAHLVGSMQAGLTPGGQGWWDDGMSQLQPWGFAIESISVPHQLWHGRHDRFVPFQHGEWLAARIPGVDAHLTSVDGHTTLLRYRVPEVHSWLVGHL